jgi:eukaryotic-like serine/threonine-protein kinase
MTAITDLLQVELTGRYHIVRHLGSGGMASVFLADDLRHHRKVALKVLRPELSALLGAERFLKEIEVTASLHHPHLLPLFDSGNAEGLLYYVMPYVDGESLREKLSRERQLTVEESLRITTQVASALDYAHRHGVVHRDIKPENILLQEGQALIADFGIALAVREAGGSRLTETGLSLGTPQYMSPEQATGDRVLDARSDVYSLAAVLYELLVGEPPHTGPTVQAIIAKLLTDKPRSVTGLRPAVPRHVAAAIDVALAKLPADRFESIAEFVHALESPEWYARTSMIQTSSSFNRKSWQARAAVPLAGIAIALAATVLLVSVTTKKQSFAPDIHAEISTSRWVTDPLAQAHQFDVSHDGRFIAYHGVGGVVVRPLASLAAAELADTRRAQWLTFSPDDEHLAFIRDGRLFTTRVGGGAQTELARITVSGGMDWGKDDNLYFASGLGSAGIWRVSTKGGAPTPITSVRDKDQEVAHMWPQLLLGEKAVLYTALGPSGGPSDSRIVAEVLGDKTHRVLVEHATFGRFLPSGHLIYLRDDGSLYAVRFDAKALESRGQAVAIQAGLEFATWGGAAFVEFSNNGTEVYLPRSDRHGLDFAVVNRAGSVIEKLDSIALREAGPGTSLGSLGADGHTIALTGRQRGSSDIWILNAAGSGSRLTLDPAEDEFPVWNPRGDSIAYTSAQTGISRRIFLRDAAGEGEPKLIRTWPRHAHLTSWSPDGKWLALYDFTSLRAQDVWAFTVDGKDSVAVATGDSYQNGGTFSPDSRWLAYVSGETGGSEIFIVSFPNVGIRRQITTTGGGSPRWDASGRSLYYLSNGAMMARAVDLKHGFQAGSVRTLFRTDAISFDVSRDGERFLLQLPSKGPDNPRVYVRTNWFDDIRAKVK